MGYIEKSIGCFSNSLDKNNLDSMIWFTNRKQDSDIEVAMGISECSSLNPKEAFSSKFIKNEITRLFQQNEYKNLAASLDIDSHNYPLILKEAMENINSRIYTELNSKIEPDESTSSATIAISSEMYIHIINIGKCKVYQIRGGKIAPLTEVHTFIEKIKSNKKNNEAPHPHAEKDYFNSLYRGLGMHPWVKLESKSFRVEPDDIYVFCNKGLYNFLDEKKILMTMLGMEVNPQKGCENLVKLAVEKNNNALTNVACLYYSNYMGLDLKNTDATIPFR
ncbi:MAG: hypothetical protein ACD_79C01021G0003 [uncultured bacterium]|nr:MAG: hypothetical protein ACD_79C01021G0003 [uncultured bacterium]